MNVYYATFTNTSDPNCWKFVTKIYVANYVDEAKDNANKDWKTNYKGWHMTFYEINYFDSYRSAVVSEVHK